MNRKIKTIIPILAVAMLLACALPTQEADAYDPNCVTDACHKAADAAAAAQAKADDAKNQANSLQGEVNSLDADIAVKEAEIAKSEAEVSDLKSQIAELQKEYDEQEAALVELLAEIHFGDAPDAVKLLAGSDSLSDYTDKENRETSMESEISAAADELEKKQTELQEKQAAVESNLASQEANRNEITQKRQDKANLVAKYQGNADAYAADAAAANQTMQEEINKRAQEIARNNSSGAKVSGHATSYTNETRSGSRGSYTNSYPYAGDCPGSNLAYVVRSYYVCQCTSYAAEKVAQYWGVSVAGWHDARYWGSYAKRAGYTVNSTPAAHTVAYSTSGTYGHVMWVESVNSDGTINLTEYNNWYSAGGHAGDWGVRENVNPSQYQYIHFN